MDELLQDIKDLLDVAAKEELRVKHRKIYQGIVQRYSQAANDDETSLKDLREVEKQLNQLHQAFNPSS